MDTRKRDRGSCGFESMMSCRVEIMGSDWANLPEHLLYLILERFEFLSDFVRFSVVCTSWLCVAKDNRKLAEILSRRQPPMLFDC